MVSPLDNEPFRRNFWMGIALLRPNVLATFIVLILIAGWFSDDLFVHSGTSREVLAWLQIQGEVTKRFGALNGAAIARVTDHRTRATGTHEREFVIVLDKCASAGRIVVVDSMPAGPSREFQHQAG
jgi:hypothetical protein